MYTLHGHTRHTRRCRHLLAFVSAFCGGKSTSKQTRYLHSYIYIYVYMYTCILIYMHTLPGHTRHARRCRHSLAFASAFCSGKQPKTNSVTPFIYMYLYMYI